MGIFHARRAWHRGVGPSSRREKDYCPSRQRLRICRHEESVWSGKSRTPPWKGGRQVRRKVTGKPELTYNNSEHQ